MLLRKKEQIETWLNKYNIHNYELIENAEYGYVVNVNGEVNLFNNNLKSIDVKFNEIKGSFTCAWNLLTTLEGCPEIVEGDFYCIYNQLKSLKCCPTIVNGSFNCSYNRLTSLEGSPEIINGDFYCADNRLTSLEGCPTIVNGSFNCHYNQLTIEGFFDKFKTLKVDKIDIYGNEELEDLQYIDNFSELKEKVLILLEKDNLLNIINKENFNKENNINKI